MNKITDLSDPESEDPTPCPLDARIAALTEQVGARLRKAREMRAMSRRELSMRSGVSQRYLAQVETGAGNISIALLLKVGDALGQRIEWFVGAEETPSVDALRIAGLYRNAGEAERQAVEKILNPQSAAGRRAHRVALIGLRGAGKSTLGQSASAALSLPFVELNDLIEEQSGMPVSDVMALYGPEGYRTLEQQALSRVAASHETVILAVAGGIVSAPDTFNLLLERFHTVWLRAAPHEHMDRVRAQGDERPMAGNPAAMEELQAILRSREALYGRANVALDTSRQDESATLDRLIGILKSEAFIPTE